jgi:hypothetical protein
MATGMTLFWIAVAFSYLKCAMAFKISGCKLHHFSRFNSISITFPEELCLEIAANALGAEPEDDFVKEQAGDAVGEIVNILCGRFLTEVEGTEPVFNLSVPDLP